MGKSVVGQMGIFFLAGMGLLLLTGCPKKVDTAQESVGVQEERVSPPPMEEVPGGMAPEVDEAEVSEPPTQRGPQLQDAFFDFDKSIIREDAKKALQKNAQWLKSNPSVRILIEGHCDERGTNEYNIALGERRAQSTKRFLVALGVDGSRISTVSYGEERPFCMGTGEACYQQNRRAHFVVK